MTAYNLVDIKRKIMGISSSVYVGPVIYCDGKKSNNQWYDDFVDVEINEHVFNNVSEFLPEKGDVLILNVKKDYSHHFHDTASINIGDINISYSLINFYCDFQKEISYLKQLYTEVKIKYMVLYYWS